MNGEFVRVALRALDDADWTMRIDVKLDAQGMVMRGEYHGVESIRGSDERFPFVLCEDGELDYGAQCGDAGDRFYETKLRRRAIVSGERFGFINGGEEEVYEVIKLTPLASLG